MSMFTPSFRPPSAWGKRPATLDDVVDRLDRVLCALDVVQQQQQTLFWRIEAMDAQIQAALDAVNGKLDTATAAITAEIAEVQALVAAIPAGGDPTEVTAAVDAIGTRLDNLAQSVAGMSDAVFPPAGPPA